MSLLCHFVGRGTARSERMIAVRGEADTAPRRQAVLDALALGDDEAVHRRSVVAQRVSRALLATPATEHDLARLGADVDELVDVWTPACHLRSRFELTSFLTAGDDAIGELQVEVIETVAAGHTVVIEWSASGRFTGPMFLDDDELIEPTGAVVHVDGVLRVHFGDSERVTELVCYYDRLGLVEQLLSLRLRGGP
jgi:hypothetical protein